MVGRQFYGELRVRDLPGELEREAHALLERRDQTRPERPAHARRPAAEELELLAEPVGARVALHRRGVVEREFDSLELIVGERIAHGRVTGLRTEPDVLHEVPVGNSRYHSV